MIRYPLQDGGLVSRSGIQHWNLRTWLLEAPGTELRSLTHPDTYVSSNIQGFLNILEAVREHPVEHLVYASSSSVYGIDTLMPFGESGCMCVQRRA